MTLALSIDLGQTNNFYNLTNKTCSPNTRIVGIINDENTTNQPFYLNKKPSNNSFSVKILDGTNAISLLNYKYILTLHFKKIN
jgi:hypothetical protein